MARSAIFVNTRAARAPALLANNKITHTGFINTPKMYKRPPGFDPRVPRGSKKLNFFKNFDFLPYGTQTAQEGMGSQKKCKNKIFLAFFRGQKIILELCKFRIIASRLARNSVK